jgi:2-polyprenyl-3-methyl-5-hydroxy-6-metoxy-1,4-benzoquinol methylase
MISGTAAVQDLGPLTDQATIETTTGRHYGRLFGAFSTTSYWDEPVKLLGTRLKRNEIDLSRLPQQDVLDAGCGGGVILWPGAC